MSNSTGIEKFIHSARRAYSDKEFSEFIDTVGFSVIGAYDEGYRRQMGISKTVNVVPFFKFYFDNEDVQKGGEYLPLKVHASMTSKVVERGEARYMLNDSRIKRLNPIDLVVTDEFFIDRIRGLVFEKKKEDYKQIKLSKVYERIYRAHTSSVTTFYGLYHRLKIFIFRKIPTLSLTVLSCCRGVLDGYIFG